MLAVAGADSAPGDCGRRASSSSVEGNEASSVALTTPPAYYAVELVTTRRVPGTLRATGTAQVQFGRSPFGVSVSPDGQYVYELDVRVEGVRFREGADFVVWVTTPSLDEVRPLGTLGEAGRVRGRVGWNKFLVVVTMEPAGEPAGERWRGPVVLRGVSRSGMMHTMAGHGPFEGEPCAKYGY